MAGGTADSAARVLDALAPGDWVVLHDLPWPGRRYASIDHVVVGAPGVFVIDEKAWTGTVTTDGGLRQNGKKRDAAVQEASEAATAVALGLPLIARPEVHPVLCFTRGAPVTGWVDRTLLCSTGNLAATLAARRPVLAEDQWRDAARVLASYADRPVLSLNASARPGLKHNLVSSTVGVLLGLGVLGVVASEPQVVERFGAVLVGMVVDDEPARDAPGE